ncbi:MULTISPECIES: xanthine dehydrogenase accessory protein XdhC [unclassified Vibrio]|uniref:Xanthine dehydrogenase accessory protein XdhC n=1 Tax=Vibrio sp. HB236076 TaxID=3232307 RepID=A0AB39HJX9_9VIBR|nr:xanthine dehydrogenase accessory protein XdhC [Vibrio sp. HB161653]MDP5252844.1 xanthine dehydrogenase accessory protein XdhC [Vibrio sp. HB161653]
MPMPPSNNALSIGDIPSPFSSGLNWSKACAQLNQQGEAFCLATVVAEVGSVPRSVGAKMVITSKAQYDTLGGGNLEFQVIQKAREQLNNGEHSMSIERFSLAADLGQCCGGGVQVLMEYHQCQHLPIAVFGAGHVGQALAGILAAMPCQLTIYDNRPQWRESLIQQGISAQGVDDLNQLLSDMSPQTKIVVMTQDHQLDYDIVQQALALNKFDYVGLIGSEGKNQRFRFRLQEQLATPDLLSPLVCPIGHPDIHGKLPMQVAVSVAAELNQWMTTTAPQHRDTASSSWKEVNQVRKTLANTKVFSQ